MSSSRVQGKIIKWNMSPRPIFSKCTNNWHSTKRFIFNSIILVILHMSTWDLSHLTVIKHIPIVKKKWFRQSFRLKCLHGPRKQNLDLLRRMRMIVWERKEEETSQEATQGIVSQLSLYLFASSPEKVNSEHW